MDLAQATEGRGGWLADPPGANSPAGSLGRFGGGLCACGSSNRYAQHAGSARGGGAHHRRRMVDPICYGDGSVRGGGGHPAVYLFRPPGADSRCGRLGGRYGAGRTRPLVDLDRGRDHPDRHPCHFARRFPAQSALLGRAFPASGGGDRSHWSPVVVGGALPG
jgi:hypothetical protein